MSRPTLKDALKISVRAHIEVICETTKTDTSIFKKELPEFYSRFVLSSMVMNFSGEQAEKFIRDHNDVPNFKEHGLDIMGTFDQIEDSDRITDLIVDAMIMKGNFDPQEPLTSANMESFATATQGLLTKYTYEAIQMVTAVNSIMCQEGPLPPEGKQVAMEQVKALSPIENTLKTLYTGLFGKEKEAAKKNTTDRQKRMEALDEAANKLIPFVQSFADQCVQMDEQIGPVFFGKTMSNFENGLIGFLLEHDIIEKRFVDTVSALCDEIPDGKKGQAQRLTAWLGVFHQTVLQRPITENALIDTFSEMFNEYLNDQYPTCAKTDCLKDKIKKAFNEFSEKEFGIYHIEFPAGYFDNLDNDELGEDGGPSDR